MFEDKKTWLTISFQMQLHGASAVHPHLGDSRTRNHDCRLCHIRAVGATPLLSLFAELAVEFSLGHLSLTCLWSCPWSMHPQNPGRLSRRVAPGAAPLSCICPWIKLAEESWLVS